MTVEELIAQWQANTPRNAALDDMIADLRSTTSEMTQQLEAYQETTRSCLDLATQDGDPEAKLLAIQELLSLCHSGELLQSAQSGIAIEQDIPLDSDFVISFEG